MPITLKRCAQCARELPLQTFRRWRGRKLHMDDVCKVCKPERSLSQCSGPQLDTLVEQGRVNPVIIEAIKRRRREHWAHSILPAKALKRNRDERRRNWNVLFLDPLRDELTYAKRRAQVCAAEYAEYQAGERGAQSAACAQWVEFYEAYATILKQVINRAAKTIPIPGTPLKPTVDEINPRYWLSEEEYSVLAVLYSSCTYIPGRRVRTPQFLRWEETKGKTKME